MSGKTEVTTTLSNAEGGDGAHRGRKKHYKLMQSIIKEFGLSHKKIPSNLDSNKLVKYIVTFLFLPLLATSGMHISFVFITSYDDKKKIKCLSKLKI